MMLKVLMAHDVDSISIRNLHSVEIVADIRPNKNRCVSSRVFSYLRADSLTGGAVLIGTLHGCERALNDFMSISTYVIILKIPICSKWSSLECAYLISFLALFHYGSNSD
jgi:hypothetical protein